MGRNRRFRLRLRKAWHNTHQDHYYYNVSRTFFVGFSCVIIGAASNERYHADKAEIQYQKIADGDYKILSILPHYSWSGDREIKSDYGTIFKSDAATVFSASAKKLSVKHSGIFDSNISLVVPYSYVKQDPPGISNAITRDIAQDD